MHLKEKLHSIPAIINGSLEISRFHFIPLSAKRCSSSCSTSERPRTEAARTAPASAPSPVTPALQQSCAHVPRPEQPLSPSPFSTLPEMQKSIWICTSRNFHPNYQVVIVFIAEIALLYINTNIFTSQQDPLTSVSGLSALPQENASVVLFFQKWHFNRSFFTPGCFKALLLDRLLKIADNINNCCTVSRKQFCRSPALSWNTNETLGPARAVLQARNATAPTAKWRSKPPPLL